MDSYGSYQHYDHVDAKRVRWAAHRKNDSVRNRWDVLGEEYSSVHPTYEAGLAAAKVTQIDLIDIDGKEAKKKFEGEYTRKPATIEGMLPSWRSSVLIGTKKGGTRNADDLVKRMKSVSTQTNAVMVHDLTKTKMEDLIGRYTTDGSPYGFKLLDITKRFLEFCNKKKVQTCWAEVLEIESERWVVRPYEGYSDSEMQRILAALHAPCEASQMPSGNGGGRGGKRCVKRAAATTIWKSRQSMMDILELLRLYANRPKEACALDVGDWDPLSGLLTIREETRKTNQTSTQGATVRKLPIHPQYAKRLTELCRGRPAEAPLYTTSRRRKIWNKKGPGPIRWTPDNLGAHFTRLLESIDMRGSLYCLRHTAALRVCREHNGDIKAIQAILGHSEESTTFLKYIRMASREASLKRIADGYEHTERKDISVPKIQGPSPFFPISIVTVLPPAVSVHLDYRNGYAS